MEAATCLRRSYGGCEAWRNSARHCLSTCHPSLLASPWLDCFRTAGTRNFSKHWLASRFETCSLRRHCDGHRDDHPRIIPPLLSHDHVTERRFPPAQDTPQVPKLRTYYSRGRQHVSLLRLTDIVLKSRLAQWCGRRTPRYKCKSHTASAVPNSPKSRAFYHGDVRPRYS